ncbi:hypothetical protein H4582DRAFT_2055007 [Lactarius indigo]|nr:hypothetical protein H4582DRAFT_2055007 [Lactarius indigo]
MVASVARKSVQASARRPAARPAGAAASMFEAPGKVESGTREEIKGADAFRARVEALRSDMEDVTSMLWDTTALKFYIFTGHIDGLEITIVNVPIGVQSSGLLL